jgi:TetR/AcrR family transcriptional repressor of nem operon
MSRTKQYDRQNVLRKAAQQFWRRGFDATSMSDLVEATGLNSASMYKEFGNKEGLFENALLDYQKTRLEPYIQILLDRPGMQGIEAFLNAAVSRAESGDYQGCLMLNTLAEEHSVSKAAIRRVENFCVKLKEALAGAIAGAQKEGTVPAGKDAAVLADFIICLMHGMVLYGRVDSHKPRIAAVVATVKGALIA